MDDGPQGGKAAAAAPETAGAAAAETAGAEGAAEAAGAGRERGAALGRFIPVRKREVLDAVLALEGLSDADRDRLAALGRRLALLFHLAFHGPRERLKDLYIRFNPDQPGEGPLPEAPRDRAAFLSALDATLAAANFRPLDEAALAPGRDSRGRLRVKVAVPHDVFEEVRFHGRGRAEKSFTVRTLFGLRRETVTAPVWANVVLVAAVAREIPRRLGRRTRLRPGAIYLKLFRDIPEADLATLYPEARAVMRLQDKLILGVPAVAGGVPILLNILPALSVLLVVVGAYLGFTGTVEEDQTKQALAALSGLGALVGFVGRQWIKYERQKFKYQKQVAENAYFNNLNNNAGFFDHIVGASEDSEVKEAFLAYVFLWREGEPRSEAEIDRAVERWLRETFGVAVDFEIDDALGKLDRFGMVRRLPDGRIEALALPEALAAADRAWARQTEEAFG